MEMDFNKIKKDENEENKPLKGSGDESHDISYFDREGKISDKEHAVKFIATSYDKNGKRLSEVWGSRSCKSDDLNEYLNGK